jgi:hypothetical protein
MTCGKCKKGELELAKIRRFPPAVAGIGYGLFIIGLLAALGVGGYLLKYGPSGGTSVSAIQAARQETVTKLKQIDEVTPAMIADFDDDGQISASSLDTLNPDARSEVDKILEEYRVATANVPADAMVGGSSGWSTWIGVLAACALVLLVGLWLTLRKDAWRCPSCGALTADEF